MTTEQREPLYASTAKPWLKYYDQKYIDMPLPKCSAFEYLCHQNKNHLSETALEYYGRKFTFADLFVNIKKTAAAFRALGVKKGDIITVVSIMTPEIIALFYAADMMGATLNLVDPRYSVEGIREYIEEVDSHLLVCLNDNSDPAVVDALMTDVEQSPWLNITDLNTLSNADPTLSGNDAAAIVPQSDGINDATRANLRQTLSTLATSASDIKRFNASILTDDAKQAPAGLKTWRRQLVNAHGIMALHALGGENPAGSTMVEGAGQLASLLINGVAITPTENVNVVSETAQMPVTISNSHPYPVTVKVSSLTNSMQIVTSRFDTVEVPAHGEAQVAFTIRVATSGTADATLSLQDRQGITFGATQTTHITSALQISDKSGFIIIGIAVLLGALGLWRQFHRKKDPDE